MKGVLCVLFSALLLCAACESLYAQATAQISGTAKDQSGAVLPGVEITATQTETGITRNTVTNETGSYVLPNLPVGPYRLEAGLPGFRTYVQAGIVLQVNSNPVINVTLEVGQVAEQVEVQANAALVETRSQGVGQVIENTRILELPLNGRQLADLITLAGAAVQTAVSEPRFFGGTPYVSVTGTSQAFGTEYSLDGAKHNNFATGGSMPMPFPDATQEFKVETSGLTAPRGFPSSVSAVMKSGTNAFHGDLFEFVRNDLFNARSYFATTQSTLKRNQFGGTFGGSLIKSKLFFFGGIQATTLRADPANNKAFVPTAAILAGDWTAFTSPACNAGRQIALRAPFVNNRVDPASYVKPAIYITNKLLASLPAQPDNPCGEVTYGGRTVQDEVQYVGKIDHQLNAKHSIFGRFILGTQKITPPFTFGKNLLTTPTQGVDAMAHSYAFGDTYLIGGNMVHAFRLAVNRTAARRLGYEDFSYCDAGVNMYCGWAPKTMGPLTVTGAFSAGVFITPHDDIYVPTAYQANDDVSFTKGTHQVSFGGSVNHGRYVSNTDFAAQGTINFNGSTTGLGLGDFMLGRMSSFFQGARNNLDVRQTLFALYVTDAWKAKPRLTLNYGVRWEPFLPLRVTNRQIYTFDVDRFYKGIYSPQYKNAPAGMIYPGDPGFPGLTGIYSNWKNLAPRVGFAWDVKGDGRTSLRGSYAYSYIFVTGDWRETFNGHAPFGNRVTLTNPPGGLENPWGGIVGGNPFPYVWDANTVFPASGIFEGAPYDIKTPTVSSWTINLQKQVSDWIISGSYIGNLTTHLWTQKPINPAIYFPGGLCTLNGVTYNPCSTTANTDTRRRFSLARPQDAAKMSFVTMHDAGGTQSYQGMLLSVERRAARGVTVTGNYTWSHCIGPLATLVTMGPFADETYVNPDSRDFDRGNCDTDRRKIFNVTSVVETPQFTNPTMRKLGTGWKLSGIYRMSAGSPLNVLAGSDRALNGVIRGTGPQRANQISGNPYGDKSAAPLSNFLNPAAFGQPDLGTFGNIGRNSIQGPKTWSFDMSLSRTFNIREAQHVELRFEAFNVTNSFRPGIPNQVLSSNTFGQIRTSLDPRVMQFALKYVF